MKEFNLDIRSFVSGGVSSIADTLANQLLNNREKLISECLSSNGVDINSHQEIKRRVSLTTYGDGSECLAVDGMAVLQFDRIGITVSGDNPTVASLEMKYRKLGV
jgi:hypothetical protein